MKRKGARWGGWVPRLVCLFWLGVLGWSFVWANSRWHFLDGLRFWSGHASLGGLKVLARDAWNAAPPTVKPEKMQPPRRITVHHLGGGVVESSDTAATARLIRAIQKHHQTRRHWNDIAYHYLVDRSGRIWEGRPVTQMGAHAGSANENQANVGVLVLGNFDLQPPTTEQLAGLERLLRALCQRYGIRRSQVCCHEEVRLRARVGPTRCPGKQLAGWVEGFRRA